MACYCFFFSSPKTSTSSAAPSPPTAAIIGLDGSLIVQTLPATVSEALGPIDHLSCFLCCSDALSFDAPVTRLRSGDLLEQDQVYFILPKSKLGVVLDGADMAALAVKASSALASERDRAKQQRRLSAVSERDANENIMKRQGSVREQLGSNASAWVKSLRRSIKRKLSIIEELD